MRIVLFLYGFLSLCLNAIAADVVPYLQSPTPTSIYICWETTEDTVSTLQYGETAGMGSVAQGDWQKLGDDIIWHSVKLTDLIPNTLYYYQIKTEKVETEVYHFQSIPEKGYNQGHVRFLLRSDNQSHFQTGIKVFNALEEKAKELYGDDLASEIDLIFTTGDIVGTGSNLPSYKTEYFQPLYPLSPSMPSMVSIGNHEAESPNYYNYMKYEELAGPQGEAYYTFQIGRVLFIALNSNSSWRNDTQISWLDETLRNAQDDDTIDWIFAFCHHPGRSSIWSPGNTTYVQDRIIPTLTKYDKTELLAYGHSHDYERGAHPESTLRTMCVGGAAGSLDRWFHNVWIDYPEIQRSFDHHHFVIVDVDIADRSYTIQTWSLGTPDKWLNSVKIDSFYRKLDSNSPPHIPEVIASSDSIDLPFILDAGSYAGDEPMQSSQFQVTGEQGNYSNPVVDDYRDFEHYFLDTGAPLWEPINQHYGIDITQYELDLESIVWPGTYYWRARYRDQNLLWSDWSREVPLIVRSTGFIPDLTYNKTIQFDGRESYVEVTDDLNQARLPERAMSVEAWVKLIKHTTWGGYIGAFEDNGGYEKGWVLGNHNKKFSFALASTGRNDGDGFMTYLDGASEFVYDQWYHIVGTYNGATMKLYVNGQLSASSSTQFGDILYDNNSFFDIGIYHDDNEFFVMDGQLDDIRLWDTVLNESTIREWMHREMNESHPNYENLISYWDFNEISGNTLKDRQENNHGQIINVSINDNIASSAPVGLNGTLVDTKQTTATGPDGAEIIATITSTPSKSTFLGVYQGGTSSGAPVDFERFPEGVFYRANIYWGAREFGNITADLEFVYENIKHIDNADNLRLLKRRDATSEWLDMSENAVHDVNNQSFLIRNVTEFSEYAIGWQNTLTDVEENNPVPSDYQLYTNYPNPFNPSTRLRFRLPNTATVVLKIYDVSGREISTLVNSTRLNAGLHEINWNGTNMQGRQVASGIYFCRLTTQEYDKTIKMMLIH